MAKKKTVNKSAVDGKFVSKKFVAANPNLAFTETVQTPTPIKKLTKKQPPPKPIVPFKLTKKKKA